VVPFNTKETKSVPLTLVKENSYVSSPAGAEAVGVQLLRVEVYVYVALRGAADGDVADAVDAVKLVDDVVLQYAVQARIALFGCESVYHDLYFIVLIINIHFIF